MQFKTVKRIFMPALAAAFALSLAACGGSGGQPAFKNVGANGSRTNDPVGFQFDSPKKGEEIAVLHTTMGDIKLRIFDKDAPIAAANFKALVKKGYYNGIIFHRVINNFMIQGGDPTGTGTGGQDAWGGAFPVETNANLRHFRGALSMANSGPNSNGSQFFIVQCPAAQIQDQISTAQSAPNYFPQSVLDLYQKYGGYPFLDIGYPGNKGAYTVFGQAFSGMDVVDKIAAVKVDSDKKPTQAVTITKAELIKYAG